MVKKHVAFHWLYSGLGRTAKVVRSRGHKNYAPLQFMLALLIIMFGQAVWAQQAEFQYAAKIVCGIQPDPKEMRLARGFYATTINIHNPNAIEVRFLKKLALSFPPGSQKPGEVKRIAEDALKPDQALETDCMDILERVFNGRFPTRYIEGFIVIESSASLDVTGVYTTATLDQSANAGNHSSIHIEQIRERRKADVPLADLLPIPDPQLGFCIRKDDKLSVTVKNQGGTAAGPSITDVMFGSFGVASTATPSLAPGASVTLAFIIPTSPNCFDPDCEFKITADSASVITESNEANNVAHGVCQG